MSINYPNHKIKMSDKTSKVIPFGTILADGNTISGKAYDLSGSIIGRLTIIKPIGMAQRGIKRSIIWECACSCGNKVNRSSRNLTESASCGCVKNGEKEDATFTQLYSKYRHAAKKRNLVFHLSPLEFRLLTSGDCYYCGSAPSQINLKKNRKSSYKYNGVDRVDSAIGYIAYNCVPCCSRCNFIKNVHSMEDFISWVESIYKNVHKFEPAGVFSCLKQD